MNDQWIQEKLAHLFGSVSSDIVHKVYISHTPYDEQVI